MFRRSSILLVVWTEDRPAIDFIVAPVISARIDGHIAECVKIDPGHGIRGYGGRFEKSRDHISDSRRAGKACVPGIGPNGPPEMVKA